MFTPTMNFCSKCGTTVSLKNIEGDLIERYYCESCKTVHYSNPNMVVGAVVYWEDKVLLCRRAIEPRKGYWNLPAGFLENNELSEEGARREVWEEAEAKVDIEGVHTVYNLPQANQVYIHFLAQLQKGKFGIGVESIECRLFTEEEIPWDDMAFTSSTFALKRYFEDRKSNSFKCHLGSFPEV